MSQYVVKSPHSVCHQLKEFFFLLFYSNKQNLCLSLLFSSSPPYFTPPPSFCPEQKILSRFVLFFQGVDKYVYINETCFLLERVAGKRGGGNVFFNY